MQKLATYSAVIVVLWLNACSTTVRNDVDGHHENVMKSIFNNEWQKQGVAKESWYYRMTIIDAPPNTEAMGIAEGHWLHPEMIRWEITKDLLIGWRAFSSSLNSDHELNDGASAHYRGAPVAAFSIVAHVDNNKEAPWYEKEYMRVDWSKNLISQFKRRDAEEGKIIPLQNSLAYFIDDSLVKDPKRLRLNDSYLEFVTRHPLTIASNAASGHFGPPYKNDTAAAVIDARHSFVRVKHSDFEPLTYPESVSERSDNKKRITINNRFGFFRTNFNGRPVYDERTGNRRSGQIVHATIFNIWQQSKNQFLKSIPIEDRVPKPIIYYTNLLHPENLMDASFRVAEQWNLAFRSAVYYAQPHKYKSIDDVPAMWVLKRNSCNVDNVSWWLNEKRPDLKTVVEDFGSTNLFEVSKRLKETSNSSSKLSFSKLQADEISGKRLLEQICAALEFYTENSSEPFVYQRPGDLRFNLLNLEVENNTTSWSGYGPMLSDPITGETISATANVNLKYIDIRAQQMAAAIDLLTSKIPGLDAVFGTGVSPNHLSEPLDSKSISLMHGRLTTVPADHQEGATNFPRLLEGESTLGISKGETKALRYAHRKSREEISQVGGAKEDTLESQPLNSKHALMDPVEFIDDIAVGSAIKYAHLSPHERFLKIRESIYESVALHEIGHNVGLKHNMAGSSDALNYGARFWPMEHLPPNIKDAKAVISDKAVISQLEKCLLERKDLDNNALFLGNDDSTTQDCLNQSATMYSSIMDYQATPLGGVNGLGLYDFAAIKWAYGQIIEVFPKKNLLIDTNTTSLAKWIRLNSYHLIPKVLLKNTDAINERDHVPFRWHQESAIDNFPDNAVPYAYCDDASGKSGPKCLSHDFGPDMETYARFLKARFWQRYLVTHFAKNEAWDVSRSLKTISSDITILDRFTHIMKWYYRFLHEDPDFKGSFAEQDFLKALAIGMNHFAHVIGLPESGAHVSAPTWHLEQEKSLPIGASRLSPASLMIPFNGLSDCVAQSITSEKNGAIKGRLGYRFIEVPLGIGRPLQRGVSPAIEDTLILYSGSLLLKKYALILLASPLSSEKSFDTIEKTNLLSMSWYRAFPDAVSKIYSSVIAKNYEELGAIVKDDGSVVPRDIIDEKTLSLKNYANEISVQPAMDDSLALFVSSIAATLPKSINEESTFAKSLKVSCRGCSDDIDYAANANGQTVVRYRHITGEEYQAPKFSQMASIGAALLEQANRQKERFLRLAECIDNEEIRAQDPFCRCVKIMDRHAYDEWMCCIEDNASCPNPELEAVGDGVCSLADLSKRRDQSKDRLDAMVGFVDSLRKIVKSAGL